MRPFTKIRLSTLKSRFFLDFFPRYQHNCQTMDVFKKTDKLPVLRNYTAPVNCSVQNNFIYAFVYSLNRT